MPQELKTASTNLGSSLNKSLGFDSAEEKPVDESSLKENESQPVEEVLEVEKAPEVIENSDEKSEEPDGGEEVAVDEDKVLDKAEDKPKEDDGAKTYTQAELEEMIEDAKFDWEDEYKKSQEKTEHSDFVKAIIEKEKAGYNVDDAKFWAFQNEDLDKTEQKALSDINTAFDMIADAYQVDNPNVPIEELKERLSIKYRNIISGDFDEEDPEYRASNLELREEVRKSKSILQKFQKEISLPKNPEVTKKLEAEEYNKKIEEARPRAERKFKRRVNKFIENNKSYSFKVGNDNITYELSKEDVAKIDKRLSNLLSSIPNMITPDGLNEEPIDEGIFDAAFEEEMWRDPVIREMLFEKGLEHKAAIKQKEVVAGLKNTKAPSDSGSKVEEKKPKSDEEKIREKVSKGRRRF